MPNGVACLRMGFDGGFISSELRLHCEVDITCTSGSYSPSILPVLPR